MGIKIFSENRQTHSAVEMSGLAHPEEVHVRFVKPRAETKSSGSRSKFCSSDISTGGMQDAIWNKIVAILNKNDPNIFNGRRVLAGRSKLEAESGRLRPFSKFCQETKNETCQCFTVLPRSLRSDTLSYFSQLQFPPFLWTSMPSRDQTISPSAHAL